MSVLLLTSCATGGSDPATAVVAPDIQRYSEAFQQKLADELKADARRPCDPVQLRPPCAAWKRAVIDHGELRDRARAAKETDE